MKQRAVSIGIRTGLIWYCIRSDTTLPVLDILSACKAEEESGVVPPPADGNAADVKTGSAGNAVSGRMQYWV